MTNEEWLGQLRGELEEITQKIHAEKVKPEEERDEHAIYSMLVERADILNAIASFERSLKLQRNASVSGGSHGCGRAKME
jgi:hypothetical protein